MSGLEWRILVVFIVCLLPAFWEARPALSHTAWVESWGSIKEFNEQYYDYFANKAGLPIDQNKRTYLETTRPDVKYSYTVGGKEFIGEQQGLPHMWCFSFYPVNFAEKFHVGDKIRVKYDQEHPESSCAPDAVWYFMVTALYLGGAVFIVLAIALFIAMIPESEDAHPADSEAVSSIRGALSEIISKITPESSDGAATESTDKSPKDPSADSSIKTAQETDTSEKKSDE